VCFVATVAISLATARRKTDEDLKGLVWSLTPRTREEHLPWWKRPEGLGALVLVLAIALNVIFW
ncbi:MAG: Na+/galactose cotransporter, partial [Armatimonadetes bacterium]|nr:Na+/galactose cotransporter [Armatimonadota bacterium]